MDIKPFQNPDINWLTVSWPAWIILGIAVAMIVIGHTVFFKSEKKEYGWFFLTGILVLFPVAAGVHGAAVGDVQRTAYENKISELKTNLADEGFTILNGTPNLQPNTKSELVLQHGKAFECILYTPADVTTNILFSCGETGLSLEEIKESATR